MIDPNTYLGFLVGQTVLIIILSICFANCMDSISDTLTHSYKCSDIFGRIFIILVAILYCFEIIFLISLCMESNDYDFKLCALIVVPGLLLFLIFAFSLIGDLISMFRVTRKSLIEKEEKHQRNSEEIINMGKPRVNLPQMMPLNGNNFENKTELSNNSNFIVDCRTRHLNCGICNMPLVEGTSAIQTVCGHSFDTNCFYGWVAKHVNCPECGINWSDQPPVNFAYPTF